MILPRDARSATGTANRKSSVRMSVRNVDIPCEDRLD